MRALPSTQRRYASWQQAGNLVNPAAAPPTCQALALLGHAPLIGCVRLPLSALAAASPALAPGRGCGGPCPCCCCTSARLLLLLGDRSRLLERCRCCSRHSCHGHSSSRVRHAGAPLRQLRCRGPRWELAPSPSRVLDLRCLVTRRVEVLGGGSLPSRPCHTACCSAAATGAATHSRRVRTTTRAATPTCP